MAVLAALSMPVAVAQNFYNVPALSFTTVGGGANPLPQVVGIASTGTQFLFSVTPSPARILCRKFCRWSATVRTSSLAPHLTMGMAVPG
jgi:hypothetical protein